ncbi:MAG: type II toxin-antitoxin system CcdA family antitoxin, partial [Promethearchaeota archaeon]
MNESSATVQYSSKYSSESIRRKTVGVTLRQDLYKISREYGINLSKLLESSLIQLLDSQNPRFSLSEGSLFLKEKVLAGPRGIEPLTYGLRVRRSNL